MRRIAAVTALLLLAPAMLLTSSTAPAGALEADPIIVTPPVGDQAQTFTMEYPVGTLLGNEPSGELHTPADCVDLPTCARIPVRVQYPEGYDRELNEYFITATISWEAGDINVTLPGRPAGQEEVHAQGNDLDNYFYVTELDEKGETVYRLLATAATASNPERARWLGGADEYIFTVSNYTGVNRGFTVTVKTSPAFFGNPVEDLGTGFRPAATDDTTTAALPSEVGDFETFERGPAASAARATSSIDIPEPVFTTNANGLPVIGADGADTFGAFGGSTEAFETALDGDTPQLFREARVVGPPKPVAGSLIVFWLGLVPLLLAGAAGVWFWRRRPAALSFTAPSAASPA